MGTPEVPLEHAHETIEHHAEHSSEPWIMGVALTAAILAALARHIVTCFYSASSIACQRSDALSCSNRAIGGTSRKPRNSIKEKVVLSRNRDLCDTLQQEATDRKKIQAKLDEYAKDKKSEVKKDAEEYAGRIAKTPP